MLNVSHQALKIYLRPGEGPIGHVTTYFTNGEYSVSPAVTCEGDEPWSTFIERIFERVDYQLSLW